MKQGYESEATKRNIPNLELYTKLIGIWYFSTGLNFLLVFLYGKYVLNFEFDILFAILMLSILMFILTPICMTDSRKADRDLPAVIGGGLFHGICTIGSIYVVRFWWLLAAYGIELLVVIMVIIQNFKRHRRK